MIDRLYAKYFQKSKSFLFPALGIKKSSDFNPTGTYLAIRGLLEPQDIKLVCTYKIEESEEFTLFEEQMLLGNPLFESKYTVGEYNIYVFDYQSYSGDWFNFLLGKYSKLSPVLKRAVKAYYGESSSEYKYIESFLYPEKYFEVYSKLLQIDVKLLREIGELCDPCDLERETLAVPVEMTLILEISS